MSEATQPPVRKKTRQRSPSYPGIGLEAALGRAKALYQEEGRNAAPNEAILDHWGYASKSGPGLVTLAALKRFGLLQTEGPGKARLTNLALSIILDERENSPERDEAIRQAALMPAIHKELWEKYRGELPSDATLRHFLRLEKGFTDAAADELIRQFRETASFAKLGPSDSLSDDDGDNGGHEAPNMTSVIPEMPVKRGKGPQMRSVQLPLSATDWVTVQAAFPLSEDEWAQMLRVLEAMKPGLVADSRDELSDREGET